MFLNRSGFTLIELLVVVTLVSISLTLATPSWERVSQKRSITNVAEQVAAFMVVAQSEAQKRNQAVSLSFDRSGNQSWCVGAVLGVNGCDCTETDTDSAQYCSIDGNPSVVQASSFQFLNLLEAVDSQPSTGNGYVTFDPIRGILQPAGDSLQFTFESASGDFQLRVLINPTGMLFICSPDGDKKVSGYKPCTA
jgi:prepilin-type N-terminal cleavage/methylation domain-containing protein